MAIRHNIQEGASHFGIPFNNAYYRIVTASIARQLEANPKFMVNIDLSAFATSTPNGNTKEVDFVRFQAPLDAINASSGTTFLDKCYNWVMAQSVMSGSTAV